MPPAPINLSNSVQVNATPTLLRNWVIGQLLQATVIETPSAGRATLAVAGQQLQAETSLPLAKGQSLTLQVTSLDRQPVLEVVAAASQDPVNLQQTALKLNLPRQAPLSPLLAALDKLLTAPAATRAQLPAPTLAAIAEWVAQLPDANELGNPVALKQALRNSGLFLEAHLAEATAAPPARDVKGGLLRLAATLTEQAFDPPSASSTRQSPPPTTGAGGNSAMLPAATPSTAALPPSAPAPAHPATVSIAADVTTKAEIATEIVATATQEGNVNVKDLTQQVGAALARIEIHQLHTLSAAEHTQPLWVFELPVRDRHGLDLLQLKIEQREQRNAGRLQKIWSVTISTDLPGLGPLHARVNMTGLNEIHTTVWAEQPETLQLVEAHQDWLLNQFSSAGLNSIELHCLPGRPAPAKFLRPGPLVDLQV